MEKSSSSSATSSTGYVETVGEIMKLYKSVPPRPSIEEVEAAVSVIKEVEREEQERIDEINGEEAPRDVPAELFSVLQEVKKSMVVFKSLEQRKEAVYLVEIDKIFQRFDDLIQRTSELISGDHTDLEKGFNLDSPDGEIGKDAVINDDESCATTTDESEGFLRPAFPKHHFSSPGILSISIKLTNFFKI